MRRWINLMSQHAGLSMINFSPTFFRRLHKKFIMIDNYPYAGMHFHGDPELMLLEGEKLGAIGMTLQPFFILSFTIFFVF